MDNLSKLFKGLDLEKRELIITLLEQLQNDNDNKKESAINNSNIFTVERIVSHQTINGKRFYSIKWENSNITLEPDTNLINCNNALIDYVEELSLNNNITVIYTRVSSYNNNRQISLQMQQEACMKFCNKNNIDLNNIFVISEGYRSARKGKNLPVLKQIVRTLTKQDNLIVYDISRFSRSLEIGLMNLDILINKNVTVISVNEQILCKNKSTSDSILMKHRFHELLSQSEYESNKLSIRSKSNALFRKRRGDQVLGAVPYGFKRVKCDTVIKKVVNNDELRIINMINKSTKKPRQIADELNLLGHTKRKKNWNSNMVRRIKKCKFTS